MGVDIRTHPELGALVRNDGMIPSSWRYVPWLAAWHVAQLPAIGEETVHSERTHVLLTLIDAASAIPGLVQFAYLQAVGKCGAGFGQRN